MEEKGESREPVMLSWKVEALIIALTALLYLAGMLWNRRGSRNKKI